MNTPPQNYQPNPYGGPPPRPNPYGGPPPGQNSGKSCLLAAGITCGVLLLLGLIGSVVIFNSFKGVFGKSMQVGMEIQNGKAIAAAVVRYKTDTGSYPNSLGDLEGKGYVTPSILHSSLDPNPDPTHISWNYTQPGDGAGPSTQILEMPCRIDANVGGQTEQVNENVIVTLDGTPSVIPGQTTVVPSGAGQQ